MSDLGTAVYGQGQEDFVYSQDTARRIDQEVQKILDESYKTVLTLLTDNKDKLETLAETLLEKETLYAGAVYELLGIAPRAEHTLT